MKITNAQYTSLQKALRIIQNDMNVEVYADTPLIYDSLDKLPVRFTVNWSCFGTVDIEKAKDYGQKLVEASEIAEKLEEMHMILDFSNCPKFGIHKSKQELYQKELKYFANAIRYMREQEISAIFEELKDFFYEVKEEG